MQFLRIMRGLPLGLLAAWAVLPVGAQTLSLTDEAVEIRRLIDAGQAAQAAAAARSFARRVTDEAGFGVTSARLTAAPATGFGVFEQRGSNVYSTNEPVFAYVEVFGFSMTAQANGANELVFDVAFTLDSPDGTQMTPDLVPMGEIRLASHSEPLDAYFHLTYAITGAEGVFDLRTVVTDRASGQVAQFVLPVEFTAPRPAMSDGDKQR